jgi:hypothetical protein
VRSDFLYEVQGGPARWCEPRSPTSPAVGRVADARAECRRAAGPGRKRGSTQHCWEKVVGVSTCASHSKLSPTTVLRPDRRHRASQGADPSRPSPGAPRAVAGVASGGEQSSRSPVPGRPLPPRPPRCRAGRRTSAAARRPRAAPAIDRRAAERQPTCLIGLDP